MSRVLGGNFTGELGRLGKISSVKALDKYWKLKVDHLAKSRVRAESGYAKRSIPRERKLIEDVHLRLW